MSSAEMFSLKTRCHTFPNRCNPLLWSSPRLVNTVDEVPIQRADVRFQGQSAPTKLEYVFITNTTTQPHRDGSSSSAQSRYLVPTAQVYDALNGSASEVAAGVLCCWCFVYLSFQLQAFQAFFLDTHCLKDVCCAYHILSGHIQSEFDGTESEDSADTTHCIYCNVSDRQCLATLVTWVASCPL